VARVNHSLDELERLAELLAVTTVSAGDRDLYFRGRSSSRQSFPSFNEVRTIERVLAEVAALPIPKKSSSSMMPARWHRQFSANTKRPRLHIIFKPQNEGKAALARPPPRFRATSWSSGRRPRI